MIQMDKERQPGTFYTASISGGKDSICMGLLLLEKGYPVDDFIFFDLGVEYPETYEAIAKFEQDTGRKVAVVKPPLGDFWYYSCEREYIGKGKFPIKKKGYGFPCMCNRWCTQLKRDAIKAFFRGKGYSNPVQYVGIAADEPKRVRDERNKRYPLVEWGITEADALKFCRDRGYFRSPHPYDTLSRVSCYCCPLARVQATTYLIEQRPELWQNIKDHEVSPEITGNQRFQWKLKGTAYFEERLRKKRQAENQQMKMEFEE
jgi:3'-phosphoadenosine 5'-phosphosulfate sulfotransferase (PAPS reductase)/FAD synthetase